ncbi:MAG: ZmpA/ZmpB/ZmpC family metallo-endopeptidase, partial [Aerococcaceae bacterium]|nr:ZmpA/ZmpB/ZmpC family metallo-endopeptidase [Aerococcaceae bacterium]
GTDTPPTDPDTNTPPTVQTYTDTLGYTTEYQYDDQRWEDEQALLQPGQNGVITYTVTNGVSDGGVITQPAVPEIYIVGTKPIHGTETDVETVALPYGRREVFDDEQYTDYEVTTPGVEGTKEISKTYATVKGVRTGDPVVSEQTTSQPQDEVVTRGTKQIEGTVTKRETEVIPFKIIRQEDPNVWEDAAVEIITPGVNGEKVTETVYKTIKGQETTEVISTRETISPATDQVERVGKKPVNGTTTETEEQTVPFKIEYREDPTKPEGYEETTQVGVNGLIRIERTYDTFKGEKVGTPTLETRHEVIPVKDQIVVRGAKRVTMADLNDPVAKVQTLKVGTDPIAQNSIDTTRLSDVQSYEWKPDAKPSTNQVATGVTGVVKVTYTDNSVDEVEVTVDVIAKEKPVLTLTNLTENENERKVTLDYTLTDPDRAYVSAVAKLYKGTELIKTVPITSLTNLEIAELDYDVEYTVETVMTYNVGNGNEQETLTDVRNFELNYKKVEFKHIDTASLYLKEGTTYTKLNALSEVRDASNYFVRVESSQQRDVYLEVQSITETTLDGKQVYKITTTYPELIQRETDSTNKDGYTFYITKQLPSENGVYRTFAELITAMNNNLNGEFHIGQDLYANEVNPPADAVSYVRGNFTGRLIGDNHVIYGLKAPLFEKLTGPFEVKDLDLKQVDIQKPSSTEIGALAKIAETGKITNVAVQGDINADLHAGGLVWRTNNVRLEQVEFDGTIRTMNTWNRNFTGGLVGYGNGTHINGAKVNATITVSPQYNAGVARIGGAVGVLEARPTASLTNVVVTGAVNNQSTAGVGYVGGVVGDAIGNVTVNNVVTSATVTNGNIGHGNTNSNVSTTNVAITAVESLATGKTDRYTTTETKEQTDTKVAAMNLTVTLDDSGIDLNKYHVDYTKVPTATSANLLKYENVEKFMPLYNKEFIVKHGNLLADTHKLAQTKVISVIPMADDRFVSDYLTDRTAINKVMVYFEDGTKAYYNVSYISEFKNTGVSEYLVEGTELIYTPEQFMTAYTTIADEVLPALNDIEYYSESLLNAIGKTGNVQDLMDKLYLKDSFDEVKANLSSMLKSVLSTSEVMATTNTDVKDYVLQNKEALVMGLAYVNRWFNIDFGDVNAKELILYHQDLFGKSTNTLEWLVSIGSNYDRLKMINHLSTYEATTRENTGKADFFDYLSTYRTLFTDLNENDWFKQTSDAYMVEGESKVAPNVEVRAYHRLLNEPEAKKFILPLLTAREGIFFISNMTTINFGMYDRYMDMNLKNTNPEEYKREVARVEKLVDQANTRYRDHFDFWYRMSLDHLKSRNIKTVPNWDGYLINRTGQWLQMTGPTANDAIKDFFGPLDGNSASHFGRTAAGAYATGSLTHFISDRMLDDYGSSVYTHEMVHNSDSPIYLGGYGRRFGQGAELFALGFLQSPSSHSSDWLSINTLFDFTGTDRENATNRYHAVSPERFTTRQDLQDYYRGVFDVLYTLNYAESEAVLALPKESQRGFYNKIENEYIKDISLNIDTHAANVIKKFTEDEWNALNLNSVHDLIENDMLSSRDLTIGATETSRKFNRNGYYTINMFSPIYSALHNPNGSPGDIMFRQMAYELLAEKGYENGFLPYASGQLSQDAKNDGSVGTETWPYRHEVGRVTDNHVFSKVFGSEYADWKEFKKAMYDRRIARVNDLKAVTINHNGRDITITSYAEMKQLIEEATREDLRLFVANNSSSYSSQSRVKALKAKIFNAYLRSTNDFRDSIYN